MAGEKDTLLQTYGLFHGTEEQLGELPPQAVAGYRPGSFGVTALVKRYEMPGTVGVENATLDDLMLYSIKGAEAGKGEKLTCWVFCIRDFFTAKKELALTGFMALAFLVYNLGFRPGRDAGSHHRGTHLRGQPGAHLLHSLRQSETAGTRLSAPPP